MSLVINKFKYGDEDLHNDGAGERNPLGHSSRNYNII